MVQRVDALLDHMASFGQWPMLGASHEELAVLLDLLGQEIRSSRLVELLPGNYLLPIFWLLLLLVCCRLLFLCCTSDLGIARRVLLGFSRAKRPLV